MPKPKPRSTSTSSSGRRDKRDKRDGRRKSCSLCQNKIDKIDYKERRQIISNIERMIADEKAAVKTFDTAMAKLEVLQQGDFEGIFEAMDGLPVVVRLIDPPREGAFALAKALADLHQDGSLAPGWTPPKRKPLYITPILQTRRARSGGGHKAKL